MNINISFGTAGNSIFSIQEIRNAKLDDYVQAKKKLEGAGLDAKLHRVILRQTHSNLGRIAIKNTAPFEHEGDYLITKEKNVIISVLTADCLPIIIHDPNKNVIAIIHAGWKGALNNIVNKTVMHMTNEFSAKPKDLIAIFGPSAKACCYNVGPEFGCDYVSDNLNKSLFIKGGIKYFDNVKYNALELQDLGVQKINLDKNLCTICNLEYGSYRRLKENSPLNLSSVYLE